MVYLSKTQNYINMNSKTHKLDLIVQNPRLRDSIEKRLANLGISRIELVEEGKLYGLKLDESKLSRYFSGKKEKIPTQREILWMAYRYGIKVSLEIKVENFTPESEKEFIKFAKMFSNE